MTRVLVSADTTASRLALSSSFGSFSSQWLDSDTLPAALLFSNDTSLGCSIMATCRRAEHSESNIGCKLPADFTKIMYVTSVKTRSDWQTGQCERGFWCHFSGTNNWRQKLAGIEHVLFQASFCCETPPLIGRSSGDRIFSKQITTFLNKKLA